MRTGGGAGKGADFERTFAKRLSSWASGGTRTDVFWRTPGSGSRARNIDAHAHAGDICATHESGRPFCAGVILELKCYRKVDWRHLFFESRGEFYKYWRKLVKDADDSQRLPLLVIKENARENILITDGVGNAVLFNSAPSLLVTETGMYVQYLETLLQYDYAAVCARLTKYHTHRLQL